MTSTIVKNKNTKVTKTFGFNTSKQVLQVTECTHKHKGIFNMEFWNSWQHSGLRERNGAACLNSNWHFVVSCPKRWAQQWLWAAAAAEPASPGTGTEPAGVSQSGSTYAQHQPHIRPQEDMEMVHALPAMLGTSLLLQLVSAWPVLREND